MKQTGKIVEIIEEIKEGFRFLDGVSITHLYEYDHVVFDIIASVLVANKIVDTLGYVVDVNLNEPYEILSTYKSYVEFKEEIALWYNAIEELCQSLDDEEKANFTCANTTDERLTNKSDADAKSKLENDLKPTYNTCLDLNFLNMIKSIDMFSEDELFAHIKEQFYNIRKTNSQNGKTLIEYHNTYTYWGTFNPHSGDYTLIKSRVKELKEHSSDILWLYNNLCDYRSKFTLYAIINYWINFDFATLDRAKDRNFYQCFDLDIFNYNKDEILVDIGSYTGNTVLDYMQSFSEYKKMYCYEMAKENFLILQDKLKNFSNIKYIQKAVSDNSNKLKMKSNKNEPAANAISDVGDIEIDAVTIDNDILEPVTFIKIDVNGYEQVALRGCYNKIKQNHPKLAIATYYSNKNLWEIPKYIKNINNDYKLYMRYYGGNLIPTEYMLLAK